MVEAKNKTHKYVSKFHVNTLIYLRKNTRRPHTEIKLITIVPEVMEEIYGGREKFFLSDILPKNRQEFKCT